MIRPKSLKSLSIVFPCYNEADNVGSMIEEAIKVGENYGVDYEVVVVDDGSRDGSAEIVRGWATRSPRVRLVQHAENLGYGVAIRSCLGSATKDFVFLVDGDNQFHLSDIEKLFSKIDSCDMVTGFRISRRDKSYRRLNGFLWTKLTRLLFKIPVRDVDCAFKLFRRKCIEDLDLKSNHLLIHAEIMARLKKKGCRLEEIGVDHYPRMAGKASATGLTRIFKTFLELSRLYRRIRQG